MRINYNKIMCCLSGVLMMAAVAGCGSGAFLVQPVSSAQGLKETQLHCDEGLWIRDKIAIIDVDGIIANQSQSSLLSKGDNPASLFVEKLQAAQHDDNVKAIVLRINSPGGTVAASDIMYHALLEFRAKSKKPVVACMLDVAASGGYYLACGSDGIVAVPSTVTGSIGVIMQTVSLAGTMKLVGVKAVAIKSGKLKDMASPLHDLEPEEEKILQDIVMQFYENFLDVVLKGRKDISREKLMQLADGRVFTARQALEEKLIDRIGYPQDAINWAKAMAGVKKSRTIIYHRPYDYIASYYGTAAGDVPPATQLINIEIPDWLNGQRAQFLYLWQPGME